jgi:hypothetical protein
MWQNSGSAFSRKMGTLVEKIRVIMDGNQNETSAEEKENDLDSEEDVFVQRASVNHIKI